MIRKGQYPAAISSLNKSISELDALAPQSQAEEDIVAFNRRRSALLSNLALCYKQLDENERVIE